MFKLEDDIKLGKGLELQLLCLAVWRESGSAEGKKNKTDTGEKQEKTKRRRGRGRGRTGEPILKIPCLQTLSVSGSTAFKKKGKTLAAMTWFYGLLSMLIITATSHQCRAARISMW